MNKKAAIIGEGFDSIVKIEKIDINNTNVIDMFNFDYIILDIRHISNKREVDSIISAYKKTQFYDTDNNIDTVNTNKIHIIIADDDEISREIAKDAVLEIIPSANIVETSTGEESEMVFIDMIKKNRKPSIIILDINFGEGRKTGIEVLKKIRDIEINYGHAIRNKNKEIESKNNMMTNVIIYTSSQEDVYMIISARLGANIVQKNLPDIKSGIQYFLNK